MLTGRAAFAGETVSDTLAHVLEHEPAGTCFLQRRRPRFAGFCTAVSRRSRRNACATSATRGSIWTNGLVSRPSCLEPGCWAPGARSRSGLLSVWLLPPLSLGPLVGSLSPPSLPLSADSPTSSIRTSRLPTRPGHSRRSRPTDSRLYTPRAVDCIAAHSTSWMRTLFAGLTVRLRRPSSRPMGRRSATGTQRPASSAGLRWGEEHRFR